jgi:hypothetical protein
MSVRMYMPYNMHALIHIIFGKANTEYVVLQLSLINATINNIHCIKSVMHIAICWKIHNPRVLVKHNLVYNLTDFLPNPYSYIPHSQYVGHNAIALPTGYTPHIYPGRINQTGNKLCPW